MKPASELIGLCFPGQPTAIDPEAFFAGPDSLEYMKAVHLCAACPLYFDCQDVAREQGIPYGIWGGEPKGARERFWKSNGGKPQHFQNMISRLGGPTFAGGEQVA